MRLKAVVKRAVLRWPLAYRVVREWRGRTRTVRLGGVSVSLTDRSRSLSHTALVREFLSDVYGLNQIEFRPGDVVIDIGAHVGVESAYLGKRYPFLRILAFEPVPENFASLQANLRRNEVTNVEPYRLAVTGDGRRVSIWTDLEGNSGGGAHDRPESHFRGRRCFPAESVTLDDIFEEHGIERCRLLKIDCEGAEHETLRASRYLDRIDYLSGEFHQDDHLRGEGHSIDGLIDHCAQWIPRENMRIVRDEQ